MHSTYNQLRNLSRRGGYRPGGGAKPGNKNASKGFTKRCATCRRIFSLSPCYAARVFRCSEECRLAWYAERKAGAVACRKCGKPCKTPGANKGARLCAYHAALRRERAHKRCTECVRPVYCRGLCRSHYWRWLRAERPPESHIRKCYGLRADAPAPLIALASAIYRARRASRGEKSA